MPGTHDPRRSRAEGTPVDEARSPAPADGKALVPIGRVRRAHGIAGEVLTEAFGDTLGSLTPGESVIARFTRAARPDRELTVRAVRPTHGEQHLLQFDNVLSREQGVMLGGAEVCVPRCRLAELSPDEFYRSDLLGLEVFTESGTALGRIDAFLELPQHEVLIVRHGTRETLLPMIEGTILSIDLVSKRIVAAPFLEERAAVDASPASRSGEANGGADEDPAPALDG
jgi:16S rRNA processing protein RimM